MTAVTPESDQREEASAARRSGVVLAGGASRRFGPDEKALAELEGTPLLARVVDRASVAVDEVIVGCRPAQVEDFERALPSDAVDRFVVDPVPGSGPLAGILAGFDAASGPYTAVVACDMPFVDPTILEELFERATGADAAIPLLDRGELQPVQAVYRTAAMQDVAAELLPEEASVRRAIDALETVHVPADRFTERSFHNVNTRRDLEAARRRCGVDR